MAGTSRTTMNSGRLQRSSPGDLWVVSAGESFGVSRGRGEEAFGGVWAAGLAENGAGRDLQGERTGRRERESRGRRERVSRKTRAGSLPACVLCFPPLQNYQNAPRVFRPLNVRSGSYPGVPPVHELVSTSRTQWRTPFSQILFLK